MCEVFRAGQVEDPRGVRPDPPVPSLSARLVGDDVGAGWAGGVGVVNCNTTSVTVLMGCRLAIRYADDDPPVRKIMRDFGVSRACAYRWKSAIREAKLMESMAAADRALRC